MRTDQQLKQDVTNELRWEPSVNEAHIGVSVTNGIVTLSGHVPTYGEKYGAGKAAKRVTIDTRDGKVILRGEVRSWAEQYEAQRAARSAPGVINVENDLVVTA